MAKKLNNFIKFGRLASLVKKIADNNPDLKQRILAESTSTSNNSWNKIQRWTSTNLFANFKQFPAKDFTIKKVRQAIDSLLDSKKQSKCHNVFAIPDSDLGVIDPFTLEETLRELPQNTQVQIALEGVNRINTGIIQIKDATNVGNGELTNAIRAMYPEIRNIAFFKLRKKDAKKGDKSNCAYFIKIVFVGDEEAGETLDEFLTDDEKERRIIKGINVKDLTEKQRKDRKQLKDLLKKELDSKKSKTKKRAFKTPSKVIDKDDEKLVIKPKDDEEKSGERVKQIRGLIDDLRQDVKDGLITKKFFQQEIAKLTQNLNSGGKI